MAVLDSTLLYIVSASLYFPPHNSTMSLCHYICLYFSSTSLYLTVHYSTMALLHTTWLYITLPWLCFTLLTLYLLYHSSTSLYLTLHYIGSTSLCFTPHNSSYHGCTSLNLMKSTLLYYGSTSLHLTLHYSTIALLHSTLLYITRPWL